MSDGMSDAYWAGVKEERRREVERNDLRFNSAIRSHMQTAVNRLYEHMGNREDALAALQREERPKWPKLFASQQKLMQTLKGLLAELEKGL